MKIYLSKRSKYGFDLFFVIKYLQFLFEKKSSIPFTRETSKTVPWISHPTRAINQPRVAFLPVAINVRPCVSRSCVLYILSPRRHRRRRRGLILHRSTMVVSTKTKRFLARSTTVFHTFPRPFSSSPSPSACFECHPRVDREMKSCDIAQRAVGMETSIEEE